jgi:hypothetical protein
VLDAPPEPGVLLVGAARQDAERDGRARGAPARLEVGGLVEEALVERGERGVDALRPQQRVGARERV